MNDAEICPVPHVESDVSVTSWHPVTAEVLQSVWSDVFAKWPGSLGILDHDEKPIFRASNRFLFDRINNPLCGQCYREVRVGTDKFPYYDVKQELQIHSVKSFRLGAYMCYRILRTQAEVRAGRLPLILESTMRSADVFPTDARDGFRFHQIDAGISSYFEHIGHFDKMFGNLSTAGHYIGNHYFSNHQDFLKGAYVLFAPFDFLRNK